jgi:hypothetical protein
MFLAMFQLLDVTDNWCFNIKQIILWNFDN